MERSFRPELCTNNSIYIDICGDNYSENVIEIICNTLYNTTTCKSLCYCFNFPFILSLPHCLFLPPLLLLLSLPPSLTPFIVSPSLPYSFHCFSFPPLLLSLFLPPSLTPFIVSPSLPYSFHCLSLPPLLLLLSLPPSFPSSSLLTPPFSYLASSKVNYEVTKHGQANSRRFAVNFTCFDNLNSCTYVESSQCNQPLVVQCIQGQLLKRINYF